MSKSIIMINQEYSSKKTLMIGHILKSINPKIVKIEIKSKYELENTLN
jgi:hypothetical protein